MSGCRNLVAATIEPGERFNVFAGNNGQGKTNLLEALYAVCTLRSFRSPRLRELITIGQEQAYMAARVDREGLERRYELTLGARSRVVRLDGNSVRPISRYFGEFNVVLFAPEDLLVARGSPGDRRRFLDRAVFTREPAFLATAQDYEKVLKNRNALLKDERSSWAHREELLAVYDKQLAELGSRRLQARLDYLDDLRPLFVDAFEAITHSGLKIGFSYQPSGELQALENLEEQLLAALSSSRAADLARGTTSVGPHRDVLEFQVEGNPAPSFASQGQLRAMILAWKTAEMQLLARHHSDPPVLLLDDVSSELDPERNEYLFEFLRTRENQCFITTTHPDFVLLGRDRVDFTVEEGRITRTSR